MMTTNLLLLGLISFAFGTERSEKQVAKEYVEKLYAKILEKQEKTAKININMFAENKNWIKSKKLQKITEENENDEENDQLPLSQSSIICEDTDESQKFETEKVEPKNYDTSFDKKRVHINPEQYKQVLWEQYLGFLLANDYESFSILQQSAPSPLERDQFLYTQVTEGLKPVILAEFIETIRQGRCRNVAIFEAMAEAVMSIQWVGLYLSWKYTTKDLLWHDIDRLETFLINILPAKKRFEFIGHIMEDQRPEFARRFNSKEIQQEVHQEEGRKFWGRELYLKAVNRVRIILENEALEIASYNYKKNYSRQGLKNTLTDKIHEGAEYQNIMKQEQNVFEQNKNINERIINELTNAFPNINIKCVKAKKQSQYFNQNEFEEESDELTEACEYKPETSTKIRNSLLTVSNLNSLGSTRNFNDESDAGTVFTARTYDSFFTMATRGTSCITYNTHYQERKNDDRRFKNGVFTDPETIPRAQEAKRYADDNDKWERGTIDNTGAGRRWNVIYENQKFVFLPDRITALTVIPIATKYPTGPRGKQYKNKK